MLSEPQRRQQERVQAQQEPRARRVQADKRMDKDKVGSPEVARDKVDNLAEVPLVLREQRRLDSLEAARDKVDNPEVVPSAPQQVPGVLLPVAVPLPGSS